MPHGISATFNQYMKYFFPPANQSGRKEANLNVPVQVQPAQPQLLSSVINASHSMLEEFR